MTIRPIPIFMYHNIGTASPLDLKPKLYVKKISFRMQMALLSMLGFRGLSMNEAMPYLRGAKNGKVVVITFDDGYVDTLDLALPILQRYGFTATCYVVSKKLGQHNTWDSHKIGAAKRLMNKQQMLKWHDAGMEVGAHSQTHPHLINCNEADLENEVIGCKANLEALLGAPVSQFCYPYGAFNKRVVEVVNAAGYAAATTTNKGVAMVGSDLCTLPRERPRLARIIKLALNLK